MTVYLKGDGNGEVESLTWTGQGDIISMGATSIVVDRILNENLSMDEILEEDYEELIDSIGRDIIGNRTRHATLGLSTIKAAVRLYRRASEDKERAGGQRPRSRRRQVLNGLRLEADTRHSQVEEYGAGGESTSRFSDSLRVRLNCLTVHPGAAR